MRTRINAIVACDRQWAIAKKGEIPWQISDDLKHFKQTTMGHIVLMGRKTYESLPRSFCPLPGRITVVMSRSKFTIANCCDSKREFQTLEPKNLLGAIEYLETSDFTKDREIFIAGGAEIYDQALSLDVVDRIIMTQVQGVYKGDQFFPGLPGFWNKKLLQNDPRFDIIEYTKYGAQEDWLYNNRKAYHLVKQGLAETATGKLEEGSLD